MLNTHKTQQQKSPHNFIKDEEKEINRLSRRHMKGPEAPKKISLSLVDREMQIKSIMNYLLTQVRMAYIKKTRNKCW